MQVSVKGDVKKLARRLKGIQERQIPFATATAINAVIKSSAPAVKQEMQRVFDRPTRWTLNSYRVIKWAKKRDLTGIVGFKDLDYKGGPGGKESSSARYYLKPHMYGGARRPKGLEALLRSRGLLGKNEFVVPSIHQRLDNYGNVSRGVIQKILANLQALRDPYSNTPSGGARGGKKRAEYFFTRSGVRGARLTAIWKRTGTNAVPVFIVVDGPPQYKERFDPTPVVQQEINKRFAIEFEVAMKKAIATAR